MARAARRVRLDEDIKPVSEFRADAAELIEQTVDEVDLLRDVGSATDQIEAERGVSNRKAKAELRRRFSR
jgi:hypothetical protein